MVDFAVNCTERYCPNLIRYSAAFLCSYAGTQAPCPYANRELIDAHAFLCFTFISVHWRLLENDPFSFGVRYSWLDIMVGQPSPVGIMIFPCFPE